MFLRIVYNHSCAVITHTAGRTSLKTQDCCMVTSLTHLAIGIKFQTVPSPIPNYVANIIYNKFWEELIAVVSFIVI
jgi:hypothetical protein